ncbi:DMT family transporter [Aquimarina agarivorans]|uniref:DMT family transporter n=1 Tax=Aquimarina agarivorans TaxID=980584 RepID=UPI000248FCA8|nr:DMT family transporter [Aquimarina agarivorans]
MNQRQLALVAASFVAIFYAANFSIAKNVMPHYIKPFGFILFRVTGAGLLFWLVGLFGPKEKIARKHYPRILGAAFFGMALNMLAFFYGLNLTTPINAAVMMVTAPMITLLLAVIFLNEKLQWHRILGLLIGLSGTLLMIIYGKGNLATAPNPALGNFLIFVNAASFACYLVIVKKLTTLYHPFTFIKWMYLLGILMVLPFGLNQVLEMPFSEIPLSGYLSIAYVVVFVTFGTYLLNIFAIKILKPTTVAVFIYFQPLLTTLFAVVLGTDSIDIVKIIAAILIFAGVYLVSQKQLKFKV